jgi:hypothetical protein
LFPASTSCPAPPPAAVLCGLCISASPLLPSFPTSATAFKPFIEATFSGPHHHSRWSSLSPPLEGIFACPVWSAPFNSHVFTTGVGGPFFVPLLVPLFSWSVLTVVSLSFAFRGRCLSLQSNPRLLELLSNLKI